MSSNAPTPSHNPDLNPATPAPPAPSAPWPPPIYQTDIDPTQAALDDALKRTLQTLLEMGICASDVQPETVAANTLNPTFSSLPAGLLGSKVNQLITDFSSIINLRHSAMDILLPMEVIARVDKHRNPDLYTQEYVERTVAENMYTNGMLDALEEYTALLEKELGEHVPQMRESIESMGLGTGEVREEMVQAQERARRKKDEEVQHQDQTRKNEEGATQTATGGPGPMPTGDR